MRAECSALLTILTRAIAVLSDAKPSFRIPAPPVDSLYSVISTYLSRARHAFSSVFDGSDLPSWTKDGLNSLVEFTKSASAAGENFFAAMECTTLRDVRQAHGKDSAEYAAAVAQLRDLLAGERLELQRHGYRKGIVEASSQDAMRGKNTSTSAIYPGHQFDDVRLGCETTASVYHMCALKPAHVIIFRGYLIGSDREIYRGDRTSCD